MTKENRQQEQLKHASGGGHLGGTKFGQVLDAKTKGGAKDGGDKARPNEGQGKSKEQ